MPSDPRAVAARRAHRAAQRAERSAVEHRATRDRLIRELRAEGWTYAAIGAAVGCSMQLAEAILKGRVGRGSARGRHERASRSA